MEVTEGNNDNTNQSTNSSRTMIIFGDNASPLFAGFGMLLSLWIIVSNLFVLICLIKNRNYCIKNTFTIQILTLSCSDLLVGLSSLPILLTGITSMIRYELCCFQFVIFISAQAVLLFHIFGICITRLSVVCRLKSPLGNLKRSGLTIVLYFVICWILALCIFSAPFAIWGKYRHKLTICSLNEMFQDNYKMYTTYAVSFYTIPTLLTNAIYGGIVIILRFLPDKISATQSSSSDQNIPVCSNLGRASFSAEGHSKMTSNICGESERLSREYGSTVATSDSREVFALSFNRKSSVEAFKATETIALRNFVSNQLCKNNGENTQEMSATEEKDENPEFERHYLERDNQQLDQRRTSHREALSSIGLVLILYDVCVIPFIMLFFVEACIDIIVPRNWKLFSFFLLTANSAFNPFIYTWKLTSFRNTAMEMLQSVRCKYC